MFPVTLGRGDIQERQEDLDHQVHQVWRGPREPLETEDSLDRLVQLAHLALGERTERKVLLGHLVFQGRLVKLAIKETRATLALPAQLDPRDLLALQAWLELQANTEKMETLASKETLARPAQQATLDCKGCKGRQVTLDLLDLLVR